LDIKTNAKDDLLPIDPLDGLVGYHLRRATGVFSNDFTRSLAGTNMRQVLVAILAIVHVNPGIRQGAAGEMLAIQRANMASLINEMVELGVIDRKVDDDDRRAFALNVTPNGEKILADCLERIDRHEARLLVDLSAAERETLLDLLRRIERRNDPSLD
jgi:DNA-binding MarR family transcriptional regulator